MIPQRNKLLIAITCFAVAIALWFIGCTYIPQSSPIPTGVEMEAPYGWQDYCTRYPDDEACK